MKCARAAELVAGVKIRAQVEELVLSDGVTVGGAAKRDPRVAEALDRAMGRAKVFKADYKEDGSVTVSVALDMRELWGELMMGLGAR